MPCAICAKALVRRQRRFCSRRCKTRDTHLRHQRYPAQRERGMQRKLARVIRLGGSCRSGGYARNLAALTFHHVDPTTKAFELDVRAFANRTDDAIDEELSKCILLCANCHAEAHHPESMMPALPDPETSVSPGDRTAAGRRAARCRRGR